MKNRFEGKVAFITGAARGQGREHAVRLAQEGADIIAVDTSRPVETIPYATATAEDLAETVSMVEALGRRIVSADADVRDLPALTEVVDRGVAEFGRLDIVVANAGIAAPADSLGMSEDDWNTMIDINLTGVWKTVKASVPHIIAGERGGSVVIISSVAAQVPTVGVAHYSASKGGLIAFSRVLAKELAPHSIRVNTVHSTAVATPMILNDAIYKLFRPDLENPTRADFEEAVLGINALPIPAVEVADISNAVLYLASDEGRYVTGTTHVVDAGESL